MLCTCTVVPNAPALVPDVEQTRFMILHAKHVVTSWRWLFGGGTLRASTERGVGATIKRAALDALVDAGLMEYGFGCADVRLTQRGKGCVDANP